MSKEGTGSKAPSAGHEGSVRVETSFPVKDWLKSPYGGAYMLQSRQPWAGIADAYNAFNNTSVFNLPRLFEELPRIYSRDEALLRAEGIIDKTTWLAINMAAMDSILFNTDTSESTSTRTTDSRVKNSYMSAYISLTNFWFGWNHAGSSGNPKSSVFTSSKDPIALLRCATCLYLATRTNPRDINSGQLGDTDSKLDVIKDRIRIAFERLHEINTFMLKMFRLDSSEEVRSPFIETSKFSELKNLIKERDSAKTANDVAIITLNRWIEQREKGAKIVTIGKDKVDINQAIRGKEQEITKTQKRIESAQNRINTYIFGTLGTLEKAEDTFSIFKTNGGILAVRSNVSQIFSKYALPVVMIKAMREELRGRNSDAVNFLLASSTSSTTGHVLKWIEQNIVWAWGGIMSNFEQEVVQNSPVGINILSFDAIFLHTSRAFVKVSGAVSSVDQSRFMQSQKMDIAWAANYEGMRIWCKEMWPTAFKYQNMPDGLELPEGAVELSNDPSLMGNLKKIEDGIVAYGTALRSLIHPEFGATFISIMFEEFSENGKSAIRFMRSTRRLINEAWKSLDARGVFFACVPHGACIREHLTPSQAVNDIVTKDCNGMKQIEYVSNLFSYKDELELPKSAITLSAVVEELTRQLAMCESKTQAKDIRARLAECEKQLKEAARRMTLAEQASKDCTSKLTAEARAKEEAERKERECLDTLKNYQAVKDQVTVLTEKLAESQGLVKQTEEKLRKTASELKQIDVEREKVRAAEEKAAKMVSDMLVVKQENEAIKRASAKCEQDKEEIQKVMKILGISDENGALYLKQRLSSVDASVQQSQALKEELLKLRESVARAVKVLQDELAAEKAAVASLKSDLDVKTQESSKLGDCQKDLEAARKEIQRQTEEKALLEKTDAATIQELTREKEALKASVASLESNLKAAEKKAAELAVSFESLKSTGAAAEEQQKIYQSACDAKILGIETKHADEIKALDDKYKQEAEGEKKIREKQLEEKDKLLKDCEAARVELQKKLTEIAALKDQIAKATAGSSVAEAAAAAKQARIDELEAKLKSAEEEEKKRGDLDAQAQAKLFQKEFEIDQLKLLNEGLKKDLEAAKVASEALGVSDTTAKAEIAKLKLQLDACEVDMAKKIAEIDAAKASAIKGVSEAEASDLATKALLAAANSEIDTLRARVATLEEENARLRNRVSDLEFELSQITSGASAAPTMPPTPGAPIIGTTAMPAAIEHMVDTPPGTPLKTTKDKVEALALGTGCGDPNRKAEGCVSSPGTDVRCDVPEQVMRAICDYSTIPVPLDLKDVPLTYSVLDPGSKVRMQLQEALRHYTIAKDLIIRSSNVLLDRSLIPLKKIYDYPEVNGSRMAGMMRVSNVQYARFLDAAAAQACRRVFETLYGTNAASIPADRLSAIGLEIVPAAEVYYKVVAGPFGQVFRKNIGDLVGPTQLIVHTAFNQGYASRYVFSGDGYVVPGGVFNPAGMAEGRRHMVLAVMHLANAAATYIFETAYDEKTVMIPGTNKIPAGAFSMLPRADINAVLATAVLYPRSLTSSKTPALAERITLYDKDETGSLGSRICAVGCEVLENYSHETNLGIGELTFEAKTNPANAGAVMAEAAKRVAEITRLAEGLQ